MLTFITKWGNEIDELDYYMEKVSDRILHCSEHCEDHCVLGEDYYDAQGGCPINKFQEKCREATERYGY